MPSSPRKDGPGRPRELDDSQRAHLNLDRATREILDRVVSTYSLTPDRKGHGWSAAVRWLAEEWGRRERRRRQP